MIEHTYISGEFDLVPRLSGDDLRRVIVAMMDAGRIPRMGSVRHLIYGLGDPISVRTTFAEADWDLEIELPFTLIAQERRIRCTVTIRANLAADADAELEYRGMDDRSYQLVAPILGEPAFVDELLRAVLSPRR